MKITKTSVITVIVPEKSTSRETFAAQEISKYLKQVFNGITVRIAPDSENHDTERILIGGPERNRATAAYISETDFDALVSGPEGMFIKVYEDALVLAGSSKNVNECERATLYAVYEFLERYLGCSFGAYFHPDFPGGEYVPALAEFDLTGVEYIKAKADNSYRTAIAEYHKRKVDHVFSCSLFDWLAKNRYNRILTWTYVYEEMKTTGLVKEAERRGILFTVGHHDAIPTFLPPFGNKYFPEHYYETHPEYYKLMEDGTRFKVGDSWGSWALCSRNPELPEVVANNIIAWIEQNPTVDTIAFWPLDGKRPQCLCPECSKYEKAENYTYFQNAVAKRIGAVHPEVKIDMLTYVDLWDCPEGFVLEPNLFVDEAVWHHTGLRSIGKPDGSCLAGTFFEDDLLKWKTAGASVVYYDYYMGVHPARQRYMPAADEMQSYWKRFMEMGIDGSGTQIEYYNFWNHIFNFFCFARTGYDTDLSFGDNLATYTKIFGEGAPYVAEIIRCCEAIVDGQVDIGRMGQYLMEHLEKEPIYALYEKALAAATTAAARNNIRMMRMAFRYSDLECANTTLGKVQQEYKTYEACNDPTGELYYMSHNFDSCHWNDPGFAIMLPLECELQAEFTPDHWYQFETA